MAQRHSSQSKRNRNELISIYVKELRKYSKKKLSEMFMFETDDELDDCIALLTEYRILYTVRGGDGKNRDLSDLTDEDCISVGPGFDENKYSYVFSYVGVIVLGHRVLKCYPKYLSADESNAADCIRIENELKLAIKVINKYNNSKGQNLLTFTEGSKKGADNLMAVMLFLLNDYYEFGVYTNTQETIEINGNGEILWDKTINETFALIKNRHPYYVDFYTRRQENNIYDYYRRLHECILTEVSNKLRGTGLLEILGVTDVVLSDENLEYFGNDSTILHNIDMELSIQYNTRKRRVLDAMRSYIASYGSFNVKNNFFVCGSNRFNLVWESVCADIFDNKLRTKFSELDFPESIVKQEPNSTLKDSIEKPTWSEWGEAKKTFEPDVVSLEYDGNDKYKFVILDAKYYTPPMSKFDDDDFKKLPGIESISKQYFYQLAIEQFVMNHGFGNYNVKNCFLMPIDGESMVCKGDVSMKMFSGLDGESLGMGLEKIQVRFLPARKCYTYFLNGLKWRIEDLELGVV